MCSLSLELCSFVHRLVQQLSIDLSESKETHSHLWASGILPVLFDQLKLKCEQGLVLPPEASVMYTRAEGVLAKVLFLPLLYFTFADVQSCALPGLVVPVHTGLLHDVLNPMSTGMPPLDHDGEPEDIVPTMVKELHRSTMDAFNRVRVPGYVCMCWDLSKKRREFS